MPLFEPNHFRTQSSSNFKNIGWDFGGWFQEPQWVGFWGRAPTAIQVPHPYAVPEVGSVNKKSLLKRGGFVICMHFDLHPVLQEGVIGLGLPPDESSAPNRLMN